MSDLPVRYRASKALFSFLGSTFRFYGQDGGLKYYVKQKAFRLKEEINVFSDSSKSDTLLTIKARSWSDARGVYDITDAQTGEAVGTAQRQFLKSMFKDEWHLLDEDGALVGKIVERGGIFAILRRFIGLFKMVPQRYDIELEGDRVGLIKQTFNPFKLSYDLSFGDAIDERLGVAATVLLLAIEGKRD